jgi:hypothetical protein
MKEVVVSQRWHTLHRNEAAVRLIFKSAVHSTVTKIFLHKTRDCHLAGFVATNLSREQYSNGSNYVKRHDWPNTHVLHCVSGGVGLAMSSVLTIFSLPTQTYGS